MPDRCALHFMQQWLPRSEQFTATLVHALGRPPVVVSMLARTNRDAFPTKPSYSLERLGRAIPRRRRQKAHTALLSMIAARHRCDVVHTHHGYYADVVLGVARRRDLPLVISLHGHDVTGHLAEQPHVFEGVLEHYDAIIVPSRFLVPYALRAGAPADRVRVIPSGVDLRRFVPTPLLSGPPEVLFVGRFVEKKGIDTLAAAWPEVAAAVPDARLRLLGYGPLESLARSAAPRVEVVTSPAHEMVADAMRRARVVVTPSHDAPGDAFETLLVVNLEAQASGRPVVTTDHGAITEFVAPDQTAIVVAQNDPVELARGLVKVLTDEALAQRLGAAGPEFVRQFDVTRSAREIDAIYDELVERSA